MGQVALATGAATAYWLPFPNNLDRS
jgi:hypothetical protein